MRAIDALAAHAAETEALALVQGRLHWDQETMMPPGATAQRAEELAALERVLHARRSDPRVGEWLAAARADGPRDEALLRVMRREHDRAVKVPADLAAELARTTSRAHGVWAAARAHEDVAAFLPLLDRVVALRRQEAAAIAGDGDPYDALLQDYEPGLTGAAIAALFDRMRPRLVALRDAILGSGRAAPRISGRFDPSAQLALARKVAETFGYDLDRGRIDLAVHPFSSGSGADVRITTRVDEADPLGCLFSTIHEAGHACYEQNIASEHALGPLGRGVSMGVHESQSRIFENQIGRGRAFAGWLFEAFREGLGPTGGPEDADAFYAALNRVETGHIRTEADEVHYNLHIMLRFDLERALMAGDLAAGDLEAAWNDRFEADFGLAVDRPSNGLLQDVHWSEGLFGYFPTYALGNVYAGCLHAAMQADLPGLDTEVARGDLSAATGWLAGKVQRHGGLFEPRELIEQASGAAVSEAPLLDYLEAKYGALYTA